MNLSNNHLKGFGDVNKPTLEKTTISKFSDFQNITANLIDKIDFSNRIFINRLDEEDEIKMDENFVSLLESIRNIGLLNPIYLLETDDKYIIISGWRRLLALKELFNENKNRVFSQKAIIFRKNTPIEILENTSIDENTKRKDLSILELSYKFNKMSNEEGSTIEDCLKKFNIGKTQFHAIKKAINFTPFIKEFILEEVGPTRADYLNKIYEKLLTNETQENAEKIIISYKNFSRDELKNILETLVKKIKKSKVDIFEFKRQRKKTSFTIKDSLS
ncbi:ParB/RepB/Spo0J family partition protein, partial [Cetobacterium sp.]|uniref:ParB/RepB/Spo0J family partition protein n=1 Tax=Cetobacterium sp. TaxID=2071632 RepID=UPI002FC58D29